MRARVVDQGLQERVSVASCGTGRWNIGQPPHHGTRKILDQAGISYEGQRAKTMTAQEILAHDYIVAMDRDNVADLTAMGVPPERIRLLTDFIPGKQGVEVPDPYYHGNFEYVYELVQAGVDGLISDIKSRLVE